ncbi:MAG: bifunctional 5,10-methylene-tetrahydrofolate dehydrogenase/5,10-methylene-tetrahydrofolate cyclohydrolase [Bacteroidetes bacterium]|nr:bifunctional 5,10-methylene-tetrahydrofolate dehydrogenase/5,10-methylene-tetrahydrofolate cyclohydrolase [Bacteroidota bacterium]
MKIIDGKKISEVILEDLGRKVTEIKNSGDKIPHLAAVLVGNNPASETYVNAKVKACEKTGFQSTLKKTEGTIAESDLLGIVRELNDDQDIDGFIVQLPLPSHINEHRIIEAISPAKDVDGFHPVNQGKMVLNLPCLLPATPYGIMMLFENCGIDTSGKHCVVLGRSHIVGTPMSILMGRKTSPGNCTVTLCHSKTKNLEDFCRSADILIAAMGIPEFVTGSMVKEGAVVIDVGINRLPDPSKKSGYRLAGDVKFDEVAPKCSRITPVPGGVGPMTIAALLTNTMKAAGYKDIKI